MSVFAPELHGSLSDREHEVAALICSGLPNKLIAYQLGISVGAVKLHVRNIFLKLGARSPLQVMLLLSEPKAVAQHRSRSLRKGIIGWRRKRKAQA